VSCTPDTVQRTRLVAVVDELLEDPNNERKTLRNIEGDGRIGQNPRRSRRRAPGANLILALNSDPSVCRLGKGDDRPVDLAAARLALPTALWCVGPVAWSDRDTLLRLTLVRRPEVLVKGGD
jgi:hypothetical protein